MIPVIIIAIAWWAGSGVVASIKAARATEPAAAGTGARTATSTPGGVRPASGAASPKSTMPKGRAALSPGDVTFGQWQRSLYRRMQTRFRNRLPGQRGGKRVRDLIGDITAASIAGAAIFGLGFASGTTWAGARRSARRGRNKTQGTPGRRPTTGTGPGRRSPRNQPPGPTTPGARAGTNRNSTQNPNKPPNPNHDSDNEPVDAELLDGPETLQPTASQYDSTEYADLVGQPELLAHYPDTNGNHMATEILTIHDLFAFAQQVTSAVMEAAEQAAIRKNSALERAEQAAIRGNVAATRAENAVQVAATAREQAAQLEATAARFSGLNVDSESLAAIYAALEVMNTLALREEQRAEAEAQVAVDAEKIAQDEQLAAAAAEASAQAAMTAAETVQAMHDTVQARQMPHAEAQAITGVAAAHESVLAAS